MSLDNQIELLGFKGRKEISKIMNESNAFVLASQSETFGVVFIEAMASGLPIIATECGGPEDFVNKRNGILVPINNLCMLTKALKDMYNTVDIYNNEAISIESRLKFSPDNISNQLTNIYSSLYDVNNKKTV